jgi:hypothetical protein
MVVVSRRTGLYWSGSGWVNGWAGAQKFGRPYPYTAARQLADRLRAEAGEPASVRYVPRGALALRRRGAASKAPNAA